MPFRPFLVLIFAAAFLLGPVHPVSATDVEGGRLTDHAGTTQLRGVTRSGTEYACVQGWGIFDGPIDDASLEAMLEWGIGTVRLPLNESCWLATPGAPGEFVGTPYRRAVKDYVGRLVDAGVTVVLDLHWSASEGLALGQEPMANAEHSIDFWASVAGAFAGQPGVVFEVFNEPHSIGWDCWRNGCGGWAGMQDLVDAVRQAGARQPIIVTGLEWGNDLRGWMEHRPADPLESLVAGVHVYDFNRCSTRDCWNREIAPIADEVPVVITEFGSSDCTGSWAQSLMDWADHHEVSYLAWSWNVSDCGAGPSLIRSYDGNPSGFGAAVRRHFLASEGNRFVDDDGSVHEAAIERMSALGVTRGCNPPVGDRFCPDQELTREQGAAFFTRIFDLRTDIPHVFVDLDDSQFAGEIGAVAAAGITQGCDPPSNQRFCPDAAITRGQWASFLARALALEEPAVPDTFVDIRRVIHRTNIERVAAAGLTHGCNPPLNDRFCPAEPVTRGQAASFFARILDIRQADP